MQLKTRLTHAFCEIKCDELEDTLFKTDQEAIEAMIHNLLDVANDLARFTNKTVSDFVEEGGY